MILPVLVLVLVLLIGSTEGFTLTRFASLSSNSNSNSNLNLIKPQKQQIGSIRTSTSISMSLSDFGSSLPSGLLANTLLDNLGLMPLCLKASSKSTTFDDPTAGMSPEEITAYISNVGGNMGMCGAPDFIKTGIGLSLNVSLILFGLLTASYAITAGLKFALEKQVEDSIKGADLPMLRPPGQPSLEEMANLAGLKMTGSGMGLQEATMSNDERERNLRLLNGDMSVALEMENTSTRSSGRADFENINNGMPNQNREERRLAKKFKDEKK